MVWIIIAVVVLGISAYFGNEYRLDRKAHKLNSGSEEERRLAAEMQEIARKIDEASICTGEAAEPLCFHAQPNAIMDPSQTW